MPSVPYNEVAGFLQTMKRSWVLVWRSHTTMLASSATGPKSISVYEVSTKYLALSRRHATILDFALWS